MTNGWFLMIFTKYEIKVKQLPVKLVPRTTLNEMHNPLLLEPLP